MKIIQRVKEFVLPGEKLKAKLREAEHHSLLDSARIVQLTGDLSSMKQMREEAEVRYQRAERTLAAVRESIDEHGTIGPRNVRQAYQDAVRESS